MATIRCPEGCRWVSSLGKLTFERRDVVIFDEVCDHSDKCGVESCRYFDLSEQATIRFCKALALTHGTLEQQRKAKAYERHLQLRHGQEPRIRKLDAS